VTTHVPLVMMVTYEWNLNIIFAFNLCALVFQLATKLVRSKILKLFGPTHVITLLGISFGLEMM
jgi:hypothetical protein